MTTEEQAVNTLKINGVAAINKANSGHPGIVLGAAKIIHTLYTRHINISLKNPRWINRDRFVMSAGHGSALIYSMLEKIGYIKMQDLKNFRQWQSLTPGHPEYGHTIGIEATTGPLGQGISAAVGLSVAEAHLNAKFNEIDHYTYVLCGDGDLQEGVAYEAMSFAGKQKLNKLIVVHDSNDVQLDTKVDVSFDENLKNRMKSINWNYIKVNNKIKDIDEAVKLAKKSKNKPTFIEVKTIIGEGAAKEGTSEVHGTPIGNDIENLKKTLKWTDDEFVVDKKVRKFYKKTIVKRGEFKYQNWKSSLGLQKFLTNKIIKINIKLNKNESTRNTSGKIIKYLGNHYPQWIGGSADLSCSTKVKGNDGDFMPNNRKGRNIMWGIREFAMASMANGIALHSNFKPFVSTFLVFADYLKPALRLSALMKLPVTYIMTHDSVFVGEDGPTHEPIEQFALIRSIPNTTLIRPADEKEVIGAYQCAIKSKNTPTVIALTRQKITSQNKSKTNINKGGYIIYKGSGSKNIIATGSEVSLAVEVAKETNASVISMPSTDLFDQQTDKYKKSIIKNYNETLTIEAGTTFGWSKYGKHNFGINRFGASAPGQIVYKKFGFTKKNLIKIVTKI